MMILVTGGAGYIGTHTIVELVNSKHEVVVLDNFVNSSIEALQRVERITGHKIPYYNIDIRDKDALYKVCSKHQFDVCIHFSGLKSVVESIRKPLEYYDNNIIGTLMLFEVLKEVKCKNIIFSSSATVYGNPEKVPISENSPKGICTNPYGWTKWMIEQMLVDLYNADNTWNIVLLRYFNPVGAHSSGMIGEDPCGIPNNLMPYITQVAVGKLEKLTVYGTDYPTHDGTAIRDYIHVVDLAKGHLAALNAIENHCGLDIYNLGTGKGYSVLDVVTAFEKTTGIEIPRIYGPRRSGDAAESYSNPEKAYRELGWKASFDIEQMCEDSWNWQKKNPKGYGQ